MRIAVPVDRKDINANIFEHFGRAPYYCIITIENREVKNIEFYPNPAIEDHAPGDVPSFLASKKVDTLITMGIGRRAKYFFDQLNITVITGASGKVTEIIKKFLEGELKSIPYEPERKWHDMH